MRAPRLQKIERALLAGLIAIPLVITPNLTIDAINLGKFTLLFLLGSITVFFSLTHLRQKVIPKELVALGALLALGLFLPLLLSGSNLDQQMFGVWGRNIGLFTQLSCFFVFIWAISISQRNQTNQALIYFVLVATASLSYGLAQSFGWDFVPWSPPQVFGTLGNTNLYGAHTAIIFSIALGYTLMTKLSARQLMFTAIILMVSLYLTIKTGAFQGLVIIGISAAIAIHIFLRRSGPKIILHFFLILVLSTGVFGSLGIFGFGPLASLLSDEITTLRYRYYFWQAAINMFINSPIYGVGLDSYGDWYRYSRSDAAYFGGDVGETSDSAHNLLLDYGATGGIFLFLFGLLFLVVVIRSVYRVLYKRTECSNRNCSAPYALGFTGFFIQALISPLNIGLLVWGFLLAGLIVGGEISLKDKVQNKTLQRSIMVNHKIRVAFTTLILSVSVLAAAPAFKEFRILAAQKSQNIEDFTNAIVAFPQSSNTYRNGIITLERSGYYGLAVTIATSAVEEFPRDYLLIRQVSTLKAIDSNRKKALILQLEEIDPPRLTTKS